MADTNLTALLSDDQIDSLRHKADGEHTAEAGELLYQVGDRGYPLIVILEGEAVIEDGAGNEIVRHGKNGFLGEVSLLSGQTVYLNARAATPMRYLRIERDKLRIVLSKHEHLADLLLTTFNRRREALQERDGIGFEVIGPRASPDTRRILDFANRNRLPHQWLDPERDHPELAEVVEHKDPEDFPLVRLPGGTNLCKPTNGELSRALGIGLELKPTETVDLIVVGGGPAGLGAAVYGASEGLDTLVVERSALGGQAGTSRLIENYLGFPAGISGNELTARAITQARKFDARTATPYRALSLEAANGSGRHVLHLEDDRRVEARAVVIATGADYRRLACDDLADYEGISIFYAAGPPEARKCGGSSVGVVGGGNSAAQAALWLARGGAKVTLLHRRANLAETMSDYLIQDLDNSTRQGPRQERDRPPPRRRRRARSGDAEGRREASHGVPLLLPGSGAVHPLDAGVDQAGREGLRAHRRRGGRRGLTRDERARHLRRRRCPRRLDQALRDRGW